MFESGEIAVSGLVVDGGSHVVDDEAACRVGSGTEVRGESVEKFDEVSNAICAVAS